MGLVEWSKKIGIVCGTMIAVVTLAGMISTYAAHQSSAAWQRAAAPLVIKIAQSDSALAARLNDVAVRLAETQEIQRVMLRVLMGPGKNSLRDDLRKLRKSQESMLRILLKPPSRQERDKLLGQLEPIGPPSPYRRRP